MALNLDELTQIASTNEDYLSVEDISFLPVIPNPGAIFCMSMNTHSRVLEVARVYGKETRPKKPMLFQRTARSQVGHNQALEKTNRSPLFDYEGEIAIVIGKLGRHIAESNALDYVAGLLLL